MAYADPQSTSNPTTGQPILAAWGDIVRDDLEYLARNKPHARVYNSSAFSHTSSGSFVAITFNSERYDVGGCHSTVTNTSRLTVPSGEGGKYAIGGCIQWATNGTGRRLLKLRLNATTDLCQVELPITSNESGGIIQTEYALAAGDYVELFAFQSSSGTLAVNAVGNFSPDFWFRWVAI